MPIETVRGATQDFTITVQIPAGSILTEDHEVLFMIKRQMHDLDASAVITKSLSTQELEIVEDGSETPGTAVLTGVLFATQTLALFPAGHAAPSVNLVVEARVLIPEEIAGVPGGRSEPQWIDTLIVRNSLIDQIAITSAS